MTLHLIDYLVLLFYGVIIGGIGLWMARKPTSGANYFVAHGRIPAWAVAFTLMATLISSGTVVGHPATVYQKGFILLLGTFTLPLVLLAVGIFIIPFYRHTIRMSVYEYFGRRFGLGGRMYASFGFLADRVFDIGITLVTTALALQLMTEWNLVRVILAVAAFTAIYTFIGGIEAVVWTDVVQGVLIIAGAAIIAGRLLFAPEAGPPGAVLTTAYADGKTNLGSFDLSWSSLFDTTVTTQWLFLLAYSINWSRRYVCDQHMVQRYLLAKSDREATKALLVNAAMCVPIYLAFMFIGACLYGFYKLSAAPPPALADNVVPHFIVHELPAGVVGLILAVLLAASMSSVSGDLNSVATVLTTDYFANFLPRTSDRARLLFGRLMVLAGGTAAALIAIALIPGQGTASIMERGVTIAAILSAGMLGLFFLGFLTIRATRRGCYVGIVACILFTAWGILTEPTHRIIDMGLNFPLNPILIGVLGHFVLFGVGYVASLVLGGYRPQDAEQLTFYQFRRTRRQQTETPTAPVAHQVVGRAPRSRPNAGFSK